MFLEATLRSNLQLIQITVSISNTFQEPFVSQLPCLGSKVIYFFFFPPPFWTSFLNPSSHLLPFLVLFLFLIFFLHNFELLGMLYKDCIHMGTTGTLTSGCKLCCTCSCEWAWGWLACPGCSQPWDAVVISLLDDILDHDSRNP